MPDRLLAPDDALPTERSDGGAPPRRVALAIAALLAAAGIVVLAVSLIDVARQQDPDALLITSDNVFDVTLDAGEARIVYLGPSLGGYLSFDYSTTDVECRVDVAGAQPVITAVHETRYVTSDGPSEAIVQITAVEAGEHRISCPDRDGRPLPLVLGKPGTAAGSTPDPVVATLFALSTAFVAAAITAITVIVARRHPDEAMPVTPGDTR